MVKRQWSAQAWLHLQLLLHGVCFLPVLGKKSTSLLCRIWHKTKGNLAAGGQLRTCQCKDRSALFPCSGMPAEDTVWGRASCPEGYLAAAGAVANVLIIVVEQLMLRQQLLLVLDGHGIPRSPPLPCRTAMP